MLKKIVIALILTVAGFAAFVATRPADYRIERSLAVAAPPAAIFPFLNDFKLWQTWSPWEKLDPTMKKTFDGPPTGKGASYGWVGNDKVGEGRMTITESEPERRVAYKLDFIKPWTSTADTFLELKPEGDKTVVSWAMQGKNDFMAKAACLFMDMDKMVGRDFEEGLNNLKARAEAEAAKPSTASADAAAPQPAAAPAATPTPAAE